MIFDLSGMTVMEARQWLRTFVDGINKQRTDEGGPKLYVRNYLSGWSIYLAREWRGDTKKRPLLSGLTTEEALIYLHGFQLGVSERALGWQWREAA